MSDKRYTPPSIPFNRKGREPIESENKYISPKPPIDYYAAANKLRKNGKVMIEEKKYDQATQSFEGAGKYHLRLAANSRDKEIILRLMGEALQDYRAAQKIVNYQESMSRGRGESNQNIRVFRNKADYLRGIIDGIESKRNELGGIERILKAIFAPIAVISFISAGLTISSSLTGNVISNSSGYNGSIFGILLFLLGCVFSFLFLKTRSTKKRKK